MSTSTITLDGNPVTLVPLPSSPPPRMVEPWVNDSVASITFPFTGQTQAQGSTGADISGMNVTYAPLTEAQGAPFRAWLKQMRGISRAFQWTPADYVGPAGSPSGSPYAGTAVTNMVADGSLLAAWSEWSNPGAGWSIVPGPSGGGGDNAFQIVSGNAAASTSAEIAVVAGQTYTLSYYTQAPAYTPSISGPIAVEIISAGGFFPSIPTSGTSGRYSLSFTVPAGVTSVAIWVSAQGSTWTSGTLLISSFQLQVGSVATPYTYSANLAADSSLLAAWSEWSNPGAGWSIVSGPSGGGGTNAFQITSGNTATTASAAIAVVAGQTYTLSCYIQAPAYASGVSGPIAVEIEYAGGFFPIIPTSGTSGRNSLSFTVPAGVTSVVILVSAQGSTWSSGTLLISSFQLELGGVATDYNITAPHTVQPAASTTLLTSGWAPSTFGLLLPDDLIQIGYRLHSVCDIVSSDANGNASFEIFPSLREDVITGQPLITGNPQGLFRLASNKRNWSKDYNQLTHLSFPIVEYR